MGGTKLVTTGHKQGIKDQQPWGRQSLPSPGE